MSLIRSYQPIWSLVDLVGKQLDSSYYLWTLENTLPYLPQPIWQDASGNVSWSDPIEFLANGTLPDNMYWDNTRVYRLEIRKNDGTAPPSQNDALIYEINNYIPGTGFQPIPGTALSITDNQITNPQFADVLFQPSQGLVISTATETVIAPGWSVITTGAGTLTINQVTHTGNEYTATNATNASYGLSLQNNGFSTVTIRQRFNNNGALWTGEAICANVTASSLNPTNLLLNIRYSNVGSSDTAIATLALTTADTDYVATIPILASTSNVQPALAWTDFDMTFAANTTVFITSVQLIGESSPLAIAYLQTTLERQRDHEFNYYQNGLLVKPIPSYLVGLDFPLNPAQVLGPIIAAQALGANTSYYAWDQTILFQSATSGIFVSRSAIPSIQLEAQNDTQMALIQYIAGDRAKSVILESFINGLSVNIRCNSSANPTVTVSLWRTTNVSLPNILTNNSLVTTLDANGHPSAVVAGWTEILRTDFGNAQCVINASSIDYGFSGWQTANDTDSQTATFFAIVVGTSIIPAPIALQVTSISLVPGSIPTIPAPQTTDEVLRECMRYYQKSFATSVVPAGGTGFANSAACNQCVGEGVGGTLGPLVTFPVEMRTIPVVQLYNPQTAGSFQIYNVSNAVAWSSCLPSSLNNGTKGFATTGMTGGGSAIGAISYVHWTANAQLGVV